MEDVLLPLDSHKSNLKTPMIAYLLEYDLDINNQKKFVKEFLKDDSSFLNHLLTRERAVLVDGIMHKFTNEVISNPLECVNNTLEKCDLSGCKIKEDDVSGNIQLLLESTGGISVNQLLRNKELRKNVKKLISEKSVDTSRYLAHFLLDYDKVRTIYSDNSHIEGAERLSKVLDKWDDIMEQTETKWKYLLSLLNFLRKPKLVNSIEDLLEKADNKSEGVISQKLLTAFEEKWKESTQDLKNTYKARLSKWIKTKSFKEDHGKKPFRRERDDIIVNLVMSTRKDEFCNEREKFLRQLDSKKEKIEMHKVLNGDEAVISIRGIAGIGKTTFVDTFVWKWANGHIYQDYDAFIKLTCRELNNSKVETLKGLLKKNYPNEANFLINSLEDSEAKILVILDGLDEFIYLDDFIKMCKGESKLSGYPQQVSILFELINVHTQYEKKIAIVVRPQASEQLYLCFYPQVPCKAIEISGFDKPNLRSFIDQYFEDDKSKAKSMKQAISEQKYLQSMASIPVYAYILCNVFDSEALSMKELNTNTKLTIALFLVFLREHTKEIDKNTAFIHLCGNEEVIKMITEISQFAYKSLEEHKLIFYKEELGESKCISLIENSGIFEKHDGSEDGNLYEFKHLVLQEFLTAIHILAKQIDIKTLQGKAHFANSKLFVSGLLGLRNEKSEASQYLKAFTKNIVKTELDDSMILNIIHDFDEGHPKTSRIIGKHYNIESVVHEYNCVLPDQVEEYLRNQRYKFLICAYSDLMRVNYFLKNVNVPWNKHIIVADSILNSKNNQELEELTRRVETLDSSDPKFLDKKRFIYLTGCSTSFRIQRNKVLK